MRKLIFTGYNQNEIAEKTGLEVKDGEGTLTGNCSEKYPEGFDYPYIKIYAPDGVVNVKVQNEVPERLIVN